MNIIFTEEQERLISELVRWYKTGYKPYYSYSGSAGTGKTTVIKEFMNQLNFTNNDYIAVAYVGKAVLNLLQNGLSASTIHSLIYNTTVERTPEETEVGHINYKRKMVFTLKERLPENIKLIIVDEAAMVNDKMKDEILSFGVPVVFTGDMNQLPPVFGISSVMLNPDFVLTKIMRQAQNDPIVYLAHSALNGLPLEYGTYGKSKVIREYEINRAILDYDQIICAKNKTRDMINDTIRSEVMGRLTKDPVIGDKVMCRQNNWGICSEGYYLTNGLIGNITDISRAKASKGVYKISFLPDFMTYGFDDIELDLKYIRSDYEARKAYGMSKYEKFEYGYCATTHTVQGSTIPNVLFIDEIMRDREFLNHLRYTAITRASEGITIVYAGDPYSRWYI